MWTCRSRILLWGALLGGALFVWLRAPGASAASWVGTPSDGPAARILHGQVVQGGAFRLDWVAQEWGLHSLESSADLRAWHMVLTQSYNGGLVSVVDPVSTFADGARFYRLVRWTPTLTVPTNRVVPGQWLRVSGGAFEPKAPTWVGFRDETGQETLVQAFDVGANSVSVAVPLLLQPSLTALGGATTVVTVQQSPATSAQPRMSAVMQRLDVQALPAVGGSPGALTLAWFDRLSALLNRTAGEWETIGQASQGKVDTAPLARELRKLDGLVVAARRDVEDVVEGRVLRRELGRFGGRQVSVDPGGVEALDRLLAAFLAGAREARLAAAGSATAAGTMSLSRSDGAAGSDPQADLESFFQPAEGPDSRSILAVLEQANTVAAASVGMAASTAVVLGMATAPAAVALAGTAGAVLFFTTCVAPAVMAASSQAVAAPFIEVQLGRPVPALADYQPPLDHLQKGSLAYLTDELVGRLVRGVFVSQRASEEVASFFELYVNTSRSILQLQQLDRPESVGSRAYAEAPLIFANLRPVDPGAATTYTGSFRGSVTETYPIAGWRHDVQGRLTVVVRGQGTVATPYQGTLALNGSDQITLVFCNEPAGCDSGGTIPMLEDDGTINGIHGTVEGEVVSSPAGTGFWSLELTGGVVDGTGLRATVRLDLGVDQVLVVPVSLTRMP